MALTWCRSVAKFRGVSCCHQANGNTYALSGRIDFDSTFREDRRSVTQYVQQTTRSLKKEQYLKELYNRRLRVGPEPEKHPSKSGCWNIEAERYAFGQRLCEQFEEKLLWLALRCSSLRAVEVSKSEDLGISIDTVVGDNNELAEKGQEVAKKYVLAYLRYSFPDMFEEGIRAVCDYLLSHETLLFISNNIGLTDLIESRSYPPEDHEYVTTFLAVIGALVRSQGEERAKYFILDFIIPQLINKDISELWTVNNPMGLVAGMLKIMGRGPPEPRLIYTSAKNTIMAVHCVGIYSDKKMIGKFFKSMGRGPPEPRLIYTSAKNTIMAVHCVGIYSNKKLIGKSPGETLIIAEEMAARDALKDLMNLSDNRQPLVLGDRIRDVKLETDSVNRSVNEVLKQTPSDSKMAIDS